MAFSFDEYERVKDIVGNKLAFFATPTEGFNHFAHKIFFSPRKCRK
jgi:hypothetical protein